MVAFRNAPAMVFALADHVDFLPQILAEAFDLTGIAFYATAYPNTVVDISKTWEKKHQALDAYQAQFSEQDLEQLHFYLSYKEQEWAKSEESSHGEVLKVLRPFHLHVYPDALNT